MKSLKHIAAFIFAIAGAGSVLAQPVYPDRVTLVQQRVVVRDVRTGVVVQQPRQRRFVMPPGGVVYQRGGHPYMVQPPPGVRPAPRMSVEQRRALRHQINEANQGIYRKSRPRSAYPRQ